MRAVRRAPCGLVPGIGPKTAERLRALGIDDARRARRGAARRTLAARFGPRFAAELQRRARFEDDSPVTQERKVVSESRETTFDRDIADLGELERILPELVERLCADAASKQRAAGARSGSRSAWTTSRPTRAPARSPSPVSSAERVGPVALDLLRRFGAPAAGAAARGAGGRARAGGLEPPRIS